MECVYPELALCVITKYCARTGTVFFPISEVSQGTVSLNKLYVTQNLNDFEVHHLPLR